MMKHILSFFLTLSFFIHFSVIHATDDPGTDKGFYNSAKNKIDTGEFVINTNGLDLWCKISGEGPVCLMPTPGWGPSSDIYFESLKELEKIFTMVYIDTRGAGRSERPEMDQYAIENFVLDIEGIRKHLGVDKIWLMGHSKGGVQVLSYALTFPENIRGIMLINSAVGHNLSDEEMQKQIMSKKDEPWFQDAGPYLGRQPENEDDFRKGIGCVMPFYFYSTESYENNKELMKHGSLSFHAYQGQQYWMNVDDEISPRLGKIAVPVLIIVGVDDIICALPASEYMHREIPDSKLLVIREACHFPWLEQPEAFFEGIKDFLPVLGYEDNDL